MSEPDRPLPVPPRSRFGRDHHGEGSEPPLTADMLAQAAADGTLEDVMQRALPEGEHARSLAMMMMGLSGMIPAGPLPDRAPAAPPAVPVPPPETAGAAVPPEVLAAVGQGDVAALAGLLRAAHTRRTGSGEESPAQAAEAAVRPATAPAAAPAAASRPAIDEALVEELIRIGAENHVGVDWLMLRAVKLYVEDHRKTGRL